MGEFNLAVYSLVSCICKPYLTHCVFAFLSHHDTLNLYLRVLTFGSYEIYKQSLLKRFPNVKPALIYALSAILGDVTGSGWLCPSEVMKQQLQAGIYPSMGEAIKGIWKKNGLGGFYQGFTGGLAR